MADGDAALGAKSQVRASRRENYHVKTGDYDYVSRGEGGTVGVYAYDAWTLVSVWADYAYIFPCLIMKPSKQPQSRAISLNSTKTAYHYGRRFYNPQLGRWLSRDPMGEWGARNLYGFVNNAPIDELDPLGQLSLSDLKKLQDAMKAFKDCYDKMVAANKTAHDWWRDVATKQYSGCLNGKTVPIEDFPGVLTGDSQSKHGVLHCALGVDARANGVSEGCIFSANVLWEFKEFVDPHYWEWLPWKKGSWGWLKDTMSDMDEVFNAYFNVKTKEGCIPSQCTKTK